MNATRILLVLAVGAAGLVAALTYQDVIRYLKMRSM